MPDTMVAENRISPTIFRRVLYYAGYVWGLVTTLFLGLAYLVTSAVMPGGAHFRKFAKAWAVSSLSLVGVSIKRIGALPTPLPDPCVFVSNHQSALDIMVLAVAIPRNFGFVAKASVSRMPVIGAVLRSSPSVFVDVSNPKRTLASVEEAVRRIREGNSVAIYPEGQRTWSTNTRPFKKRAFMLAAQAGVPVVPVTIFNAHLCVDEQRKLVAPGTVYVRIDAPIEVKDDSRNSIREAIESSRNTIQANLVAKQHELA